jgi:tetratricopeptide (TPR) repeat protein
VFRGGFRQDAAEHVAGASLLILRTLVEKSLLRPTEMGQYQIHELLRQFAAEKLYLNPTEQNSTQEQHSHYYLAFLQAQAQLLKGRQQRTALAKIGEAIENVRAGWIWAVDHGQIDRIDQALEGLYNFYQIEGRYQEGEETFGYAAMSLQQPAAGVEPLKFKITHTRILSRWGAFQGFLGLPELAKNRLQIGLTLAQELGDQREAAFCLNLLGYFTGWLGDYAEAMRLMQQSLALSRALADQEGMALSLYNLAEMAQYLGKNEEAKRLAQESLALSRALGRQDWIAYGLDKLGFNTFALGEFAASEQYYQEGLAIFEEIGDKLGMALTLGGLTWAAWVKGDSNFDEAIALSEKSLVLVRECGHRFHIATRLGGL